IPRPIPVYNVDGTLNRDGSIKEFVELLVEINNHAKRLQLAVTNLGTDRMFLGHEWLKKHNPTIDWNSSKL
ncbi:hypothetical protein SERLA73DRAFT_17679, partial [Serpula lacrymans var. lacrymans S7.3]